MAVRCEGDYRVMEQLGEKQDFESELSRLGFSHEAFTLHVRRAGASGGGTNWITSYAVCVVNLATNRQNIYWGGPGDHWVSEFVADVARGLYGPPDLVRPEARPPGKTLRARLVARGGKLL